MIVAIVILAVYFGVALACLGDYFSPQSVSFVKHLKALAPTLPQGGDIFATQVYRRETSTAGRPMTPINN